MFGYLTSKLCFIKINLLSTLSIIKYTKCLHVCKVIILSSCWQFLLWNGMLHNQPGVSCWSIPTPRSSVTSLNRTQYSALEILRNSCSLFVYFCFVYSHCSCCCFVFWDVMPHPKQRDSCTCITMPCMNQDIMQTCRSGGYSSWFTQFTHELQYSTS